MSLNSPSEIEVAPGREPAGELALDDPLHHLSVQAGRLQIQLDRLAADVQSGHDQLAIMTRRLTDPTGTGRLDEQMAELLARQETGQERLDQLAQQVEALHGALAKLSRTQFKSNALAETKEGQLFAALTTLQDLVTRREEIRQTSVEQEQERRAALRAAARAELAAGLLPALDGVEMALDSGRALLERQRQQDASDRPRPAGRLEKLRRALQGESTSPEHGAPGEGMTEALAAMEGWLRGLELVQARFVKMLAQEGIEPIEAVGQSFDPTMHVALETAVRDDVRPDVVVAVLRKGYRRQERVLRYAEVVVSRAAQASPAGADDSVDDGTAHAR